MLNIPIRHSSSMLTPEPAPEGTPGPHEFGLPEKFADWRPGQWGAVQRILDSPKRFFVLCMPTGGGKSPLAMAAAVLSGKRSVFLTSTRGLADQYRNDFGAMSCDIRGMNNYRCVRTEDLKISRFTTVAEAPCQMGYKCPARTDLSCEYHARYRQAQKSPIVITNFSCWMYDAMKESNGIHIPRWEYEVNREHGFNDTDLRTPVDMLIVDECFPCNVSVGGKPISSIKIGDTVPSFDSDRFTMTDRKVLHTYKHRPVSLCRIWFSDGSTTVCTPNHPFLTDAGWQSPISVDFAARQVLCSTHVKSKEEFSVQSGVCLLQERVHGLRIPEKQTPRKGLLLQPSLRGNAVAPLSAENRNQLPILRESRYRYRSKQIGQVPQDRTSILQSVVWPEDASTPAPYLREDTRYVAASYDERQSSLEPSLPSEVGSVDEGSERWLEACYTGRQRETATSNSAITGSSIRLGDRISGEHGTKTARCANGIQNRYCQPFIKDRDRGGRKQPQSEGTSSSRQEERESFNWVGVDRVEILEPTSDGTFGGLCPDGYVYNLEVEGTHTYIANGAVVHNCDLAGGWVSKHVGVDISRSECLALRLVWPDAGLVLNDWHGWAAELVGGLGDRVKAMEKSIRERARAGRDDAWSAEYRMLRDFQRKLQRLATIQADDDWVLDERMSEDAGAGRSLKAIRFEPLMPGRYAEQVLWRGVEKVVLMSATARRKTANLLGVTDDEMEFAEYPSTFDPKRRPVTLIPSVMMNFRTEQEDKLMRLWLAVIDRIIGARLDRKGIVHTVSYFRAAFIKDNSDHREHMLIHNTRDRSEVIKRFCGAAAPAILLSPSIDTGYDFHDDLARYAIIAKIPFASIQDKIVQERQKRDPEYGLYTAAQAIVQMTGRIVRSQSDAGESFIVDDNFKWFRRKAAQFLPKWWLDSVQTSDTIPPPIDVTL